MATIIDVANAAGVSKSTVSRVFTNPRSVKPRTLERINTAARQLGYLPNALARAMITKKTETLAFIIYEEQFPVITNPFYGQILESVVERTGKKGYSLYISSAGAAREHSFDTILQRQVDGVMFASYTDPNMLRNFLNRNIPVVLVNSRTELPGVCCVLSDDSGGITQAVSHLARSGREHIGIIEGAFTRFIVDRRHKAFLKALKKHGLEAQARHMAVTNASIRDAHNAAYAILASERPPDALVCTNDVIAVGAVKAARRLGLNVPRDVAVTGYDNSDLCEASEPSITSVDANTAGMGRAAADFLFAQIAGQTITRSVRTVKTRLVCRESA
jgi:DNA-binding LacI/PurR family transcriptional regulator